MSHDTERETLAAIIAKECVLSIPDETPFALAAADAVLAHFAALRGSAPPTERDYPCSRCGGTDFYASGNCMRCYVNDGVRTATDQLAAAAEQPRTVGSREPTFAELEADEARALIDGLADALWPDDDEGDRPHPRYIVAEAVRRLAAAPEGSPVQREDAGRLVDLDPKNPDPEKLCSSCGHPWAKHDVLGCTARVDSAWTSSNDRGCGCKATGHKPAPVAEPRPTTPIVNPLSVAAEIDNEPRAPEPSEKQDS